MKAKAKSNGAAAKNDAPRNGIPVPSEKRCKYRTEKGTPCRAARRKESDYCIFHDKEFRERHQELQAARTMLDRRKTPDSAEGVHALLFRNVEELRQGKIEPRVANSIAYHAQLMMGNLTRLERERSGLIPGTMEERLSDLVVDEMLDRAESEIAAGGKNARPVPAAKNYAEHAKRETAEHEAAEAAEEPPSILQMLQRRK